MGKPTKTIYWQRKCLSFPYWIYHCRYHGAFIWKGRIKGHVLADFSEIQRDAKIELLPTDSPVQYVEYEIVSMKCPYCEETWEQHKEFPPETKVRCPNGHLISRDKAIQE